MITARDLLAKVTRADVGPAVFRFMDVKPLSVGMCEASVQRVSYTGDLGYEIFCDPMDQRALWAALWAAGQPHGMVPFGMRAMMSLRLDRFFGSWMAEFSPDYTPAETGMDRFISWKKNVAFIGREAAEAERATGPARRLCAFEVDADEADVQGYEPIWLDGAVVGFCTSGGYSHYADKSIALALIPAERVTPGLKAEIEILGQMCTAHLLESPLLKARPD